MCETIMAIAAIACAILAFVFAALASRAATHAASAAERAVAACSAWEESLTIRVLGGVSPGRTGSIPGPFPD